MEVKKYDWECPAMAVSGSMNIKDTTDSMDPEPDEEYWFSPVQSFWKSSGGKLAGGAAGAVFIMTLINGLSFAIVPRKLF